MKPNYRNPLLAAVLLTLAVPSAFAGTIWDAGGVADTNINSAANWDGTAPGVVNAIDGTTAATFGTGGTTATINTNASFSGITINRNGNFTIANGDGSLTVGTGGITVTLPNTTARTHTISESSLILNGNQTWTVTNNTGAAVLTVSSAVSEAGGARNLTKAGTGTLTLSGTNNYTGSTTISAGTVVLGNADALGGTSPGTNGTSSISMTNGSTLRTSLINGAVAVHAPITTAGSVTIGAPSVANGLQTFNDFIINGTIGGSGDVTFNNTNNTNQIFTVTLNAANNYTGNTTLQNTAGNAGQMFVKLGIANALPTTTVLTIAGNVGTGTGRGIELNLFGFDQTLAGLTNTTAAARVQRIVNSDASAAATLTINGATDTTFTGYLGAGAQFSVSSSTIPGSTNGNNFGLTKNGAGTFSLNPATLVASTATYDANNYYGVTKILGGILSLGSTKAMLQSPLDTTSSVAGDATNGLRTTVTTLTLGGLTGNKNLADVFTTATGGSSNATARGGYDDLTALTLNPLSGATYSYSGDIGDGFGVMTLTKTGLGTQTLNGTNTYSGNTTITSGTLALGASGTISSSPLIDVKANTTFDVSAGGFTLGSAKTLQGIGTVLGTVTAANGAIILPGNSGAGSLTIGNLTFGATTGDTATVEIGALSGYTTNAAIITSALTVNGGAGKVTINLPTESTGSGVYRLIQFSSGIADASGFSVGTAPVLTARQTAAALGIDSGYLTYTITGTSVFWTGKENSEWSTNIIAAAKNWELATGPTATDFLGGDDVVFNDSATLKTVDISNGNVSPTTVTFNNSTGNDYTITGVDGITNAARLIKNNTGTVIINTPNTYTGGTNLNAGTIELGNASALGATGTITLTGGTLKYGTGITTDLSARFSTIPSQVYKIDTNDNDVTFASGLTSAGGTLTKEGAGTLTLGGTNTFTGITAINGGTLQLGSGGTTGGLNGTTGIVPSGTVTLAINRSSTFTQATDLNGQLITGAGLSVVKAGSGTATLSGNNTYQGTTTVNGGVLAITHENALGSTVGATTINGGNSTTGNSLNLSSATTGLTLAENLNFFANTAGRTNLTNNGIQNHTLTGAIDVSSDTNLTQFTSTGTGSITITGDITGTMTNNSVLFLRGESTSALNRLLGSVNLTGGNLAKTDGSVWLVGTAGKSYSWVNTLVANGVLKLGLANILPTTSELIMGNNSGGSTGSLDLNGYNQTIAGITYNQGGATASTGTRTITNSDLSNVAVLTIDNTTDYSSGSASGTNNIVLTGNLSLTKKGTGKLTLLGTNSYSGNTVVSAGTLALADNAQLRFVTAASGVNNTISGSGETTLDGDFFINTSASDSLASGTWTLENLSNLTGGAYGSTFSVVGFSDIGGDKWEKVLSPFKKYTFDETTGVLTLTSSASYATWIDTFYPGETNPLIVGASADPDFDGISNAIELVIGGNPVTGMDSALLPTIELVNADPDGDTTLTDYLLFTYRRTDLAVASGLTIDCETDIDLISPWTPATGAPGVVILTDDNYASFSPTATNTDRVRVYIPRGANTKLFGRLNVTVP